MFFDLVLGCLATAASVMGLFCVSACDSWEGQKLWLGLSIISAIMALIAFYVAKGKGGTGV